ncbi:MAG: hypothetical protein JRI55_29845 [Deltaproteobacteria bacterium]|jgi:hypothetical protein|nr:hypothetical protein [Deltaproteobacteria bacterium]
MRSSSGPFTISVTDEAAPAVLETNFGGTTRIEYVRSYGYVPDSTASFPNTGTFPSPDTYACGDEFCLRGTDDTVSPPLTFGSTNPQIWGSKSDRENCLQTQTLAGVQARTDAGQSLLTPTQVHGMEIVSGISGPPGTGITTAYKQTHRTSYFKPDQSDWMLWPNTSAPQGMVYVRWYFRLPSGFWTNLGGGFCELGGWKHADNVSRGSFNLVADNGVAHHQLLMTPDLLGDEGPGPWTYSSCINRCGWNANPYLGTHEFRAWDSPSYDHPDHPWSYSEEIFEEVWYKVEFATRLDNSGTKGGFIWAACNGTEYGFWPGQNVYDGGSEMIDRLMLFLSYASVAGPDAGTLITGLKVCEGWPADAAPHPAV